MNDMDRIILNQASIMRCLWVIMEAIATAKGFAGSAAHLTLIKKLKDQAQEAEDYALRNWHPMQ